MAQFNSSSCQWNDNTQTWVFTGNASIDMSGSTGVFKFPSGGSTEAGAQTITSANANALTVGPNGTTNPAFNVDASTASAATGLNVKAAAAAGGLAVSVISSGTNENLTIDAKGTGTISIATNSSGNVIVGNTTNPGKILVGGTLTGGGLLTNAIQLGTNGPLIYSGSGAPTISAAVQGSLYLRTDGSSTSTRLYVATNTSGTWTAVTTAA